MGFGSKAVDAVPRNGKTTGRENGIDPKTNIEHYEPGSKAAG